MSREVDDKARREQLGIEPTVPATDMREELGDFSSERRPTEDGPRGPTVWVIVGLVALVGVGFWWLGGSGTKPAPAAATTTPATMSPSGASAKTAAAPKTPATKPPATKVTSAAPEAPAATTAPATTTPAEAPTIETPAPKHAHKRHKKPKSASKHKDVKLPRLPTPPPADP